MKTLLLSLIVITTTSTSFAAIVERDPTKVLVDDTTGVVIFAPREIDYAYELESKELTLKNIDNQSDREFQLEKRSILDKFFRTNKPKCNRYR